ncbi:RA domain-containing protein rau [Musca autumnalis]|uniref:RA domain-containing protein rau n=1 Tax=Musca autumnalis TaxID=221902 RepID=UPI003CF475AC
MLKHVQISPLRNRSDSVSLRSSTSCASSMCGSPEPPTDIQRSPSRASSYSSLNEQLPQTTIKVFTSCLKIDIEYKTLGIQWDTTSKEVIAQLLRRLKMRHRDPRLFYLSMEVSVRRAGVKTVMVLDDDTRPAILQACHPKGESRFCLQLKPGGLIRVHTSALLPSSQYKSLVISEETTSDELLQLLLSCYNSMEPVEQFSIYEVCPGQEYQRKLHPDDIPLRAQNERCKRGETCHFLVRRNPNYARRRQILNALDEVEQAYKAAENSSNSEQNNNNNNKPFDADCSMNSLDDSSSLLDISIETLSDDLQSLMTTSDEDDECASSISSSSTDTSSSCASSSSCEGTASITRTPSTLTVIAKPPAPASETCGQCQNAYKNCDFCQKTSTNSSSSKNSSTPTSYSPVYNIREIRTGSHSFSPLGSDKKLLDMELNGRFDLTTCRPIRPQSMYMSRSATVPRVILDATSATETTSAAVLIQDVNGNHARAPMKSGNATSTTTTLGGEEVNNNPAKGLGHFVYI